jgi:hypothetical protein
MRDIFSKWVVYGVFVDFCVRRRWSIICFNVPGVRDGGKPPIFGVEIDGLILDEVLCGCIEVASC